MRLLLFLLFLALSGQLYAQPPEPAPDCLNGIYTIFKDSLGKSGIEDASCQVVIPPNYQLIYLQRTVQNGCARIDSLAILISDEGAIAYNLNSMESTKTHRNMLIVNNFIFYSDSMNWGAYNSNLERVFKNLDGTPIVFDYVHPTMRHLNFSSFYYQLYESEFWQYQDELMGWTGENMKSLNLNTGIIVQETSPWPENFDPVNPNMRRYHRLLKKFEYAHSYQNYTLLDMSSGRKTKNTYHSIMPTVHDTEIYYWCSRFEACEPYDIAKDYREYTGSCDVYNSKLECVLRFDFNKSPSQLQYNFLREQRYEHTQEKNLLILVKEEDKTSAYKANGVLMIKDADAIERQYSMHYKVTRGDSVRMLDDEGQRIHRKAYLDIVHHSFSQPDLVVKTTDSKGSWSVVDSNGQEILSGFDTIVGVYPRCDSNGRMDSGNPLVVPPKYAAIKDGKVYAIENYHATAVDSSNTAPRFGKIITYKYFVATSAGDYIGSFSESPMLVEDLFVFRDGNSIFILNESAEISGKINNVRQLRGIQRGDELNIVVTKIDGSTHYYDRTGTLLPTP